MLTLAQVMEHLEHIAPLYLAESWDQVGLMIGQPTATIERLMTCLTITPDVVEDAIQKKAQLIVSHHPVMFKPVKRLTTQQPEGRLLLPLLKEGIAVYSAHTAYDNAVAGINAQWAQRFGLAEVRPLVKAATTPQCKIVVFVSASDVAKISTALFAAGAGQIGQYDSCSFRLAGTGTFRGNENSNPTLGKKGHFEEVEEFRLEVLCPTSQLEHAITAVRQAHSYEEPAIDVYPLHNMAQGPGVGRLGRLPRSLPLKDLLNYWKNTFRLSWLQWVGDPDRIINTVAIVCGSGGSLLQAAIEAKADLFFTGELRFHDMLAAKAAGLCLALPGHFVTERSGMEIMARQLQERLPALTIWTSVAEHDPLLTI